MLSPGCMKGRRASAHPLTPFSIRVYVCVCVCIHIHTVYIYIYIYMCIYIYIVREREMHIYIYICVYVEYVPIYIHIHIHTCEEPSRRPSAQDPELMEALKSLKSRKFPFPCSSFVVLTCFLIWDFHILPKKVRHRVSR